MMSRSQSQPLCVGLVMIQRNCSNRACIGRSNKHALDQNTSNSALVRLACCWCDGFANRLGESSSGRQQSFIISRNRISQTRQTCALRRKTKTNIGHDVEDVQDQLVDAAELNCSSGGSSVRFIHPQSHVLSDDDGGGGDDYDVDNVYLRRFDSSPYGRSS